MTEQEWPGWSGDFLPAGIIVAHKTCSTERTRNDAGILFLPDCAVAICVLTADNEDTDSDADNAGTLLCAKVAKEV
jgi:beta-lactamase class A